MTTLTDTITELADFGPGILANFAGCGWPDTDEGRRFLTLTRDCLLERVTNYLDDLDDDETPDWYDFRDDAVWETADGMMPVYTHDIWATFVDLSAYAEDITDYVTDDATMEQRAQVALCLIAERLCNALIGELENADDETTA